MYRRTFVLATLLLVFTSGAGATPQEARTASRSVLVGAQGPCGQIENLTEVNPGTAQETVIARVVAPQYDFNCNAFALDAAEGVLYAVRYTLAGSLPGPVARTLVAISTITGAVEVRGTINGDYVVLVFDADTRQLFALKTLAEGRNDVVRVNPANAQETILTNIGGPAYGFGPSAYSPTEGALYLVRSQMDDPPIELLAVDTQSGAVSRKGPLRSTFLYLGYSSTRNTLLGVTALAQGANNLVVINTETAAEAVIADIGGSAYAFTSGAFALNDAASVLYAVRQNADGSARRLLAVDVPTGVEVEQGPVTTAYSYLGFASRNEVYLPLLQK
jgi:hypothetical protein